MDVQEASIAQELNRRLAIIQTDEAGDESHQPLSSREQWVAWALVAVSLIIGLVVAF